MSYYGGGGGGRGGYEDVRDVRDVRDRDGPRDFGGREGGGRHTNAFGGARFGGGRFSGGRGRFGGRGGGRGGGGPDDDEYGGGEDTQQEEDGTFRRPDRDFYRKSVNSFQTVAKYLENRLYERSPRERRLLQPHYQSYRKMMLPYGNSVLSNNPADGVCAHFLRKGYTKPDKTQINCAVWSSDARYLYSGTQFGDCILWAGEALIIHKTQPMVPHKSVTSSITAMAWNNHGKIVATGDHTGLLCFSDETLRAVFFKAGAHQSAIRGLSFSPFDSKLVTAGDDCQLHIWTVGKDLPDSTLTGHQADVKCVQWHPFRALIASGSRDSAVRLWDPRQATTASILTGHKKQVNCLGWNANGNWLATGAKDHTIRLFDVRTMKEFDVLRGQNSDVCSLAWHPHHESLLLSGGYNGSLCYWIAGQGSEPHTAIHRAHLMFIDVLAWHPAGHMVATASHDMTIKFWCREPPGSALIKDDKEFLEGAFGHGPILPGVPSVIPATAVAMLGAGPESSMPSSRQGAGGGGGGSGDMRGDRGSGGPRQGGGGMGSNRPPPPPPPPSAPLNSLQAALQAKLMAPPPPGLQQAGTRIKRGRE